MFLTAQIHWSSSTHAFLGTMHLSNSYSSALLLVTFLQPFWWFSCPAYEYCKAALTGHPVYLRLRLFVHEQCYILIQAPIPFSIPRYLLTILHPASPSGRKYPSPFRFPLGHFIFVSVGNLAIFSAALADALSSCGGSLMYLPIGSATVRYTMFNRSSESDSPCPQGSTFAYAVSCSTAFLPKTAILDALIFARRKFRREEEQVEPRPLAPQFLRCGRQHDSRFWPSRPLGIEMISIQSSCCG
ncbi:hypothetical protein C8F01DRAFT_1170550 [Mycena amicta]|nr:hypothetical protein C8F01DRAFT_1170550 [Mycena amicta]